MKRKNLTKKSLLIPGEHPPSTPGSLATTKALTRLTLRSTITMWQSLPQVPEDGFARTDLMHLVEEWGNLSRPSDKVTALDRYGLVSYQGKRGTITMLGELLRNIGLDASQNDLLRAHCAVPLFSQLWEEEISGAWQGDVKPRILALTGKSEKNVADLARVYEDNKKLIETAPVESPKGRTNNRASRSPTGPSPETPLSMEPVLVIRVQAGRLLSLHWEHSSPSLAVAQSDHLNQILQTLQPMAPTK